MIDKLFLLAVLIDPNKINVPKPGATPDRIGAGLQLLFGVLGAASVFVIVLAGLRYVLSQGDPAAIAKAKNTIIYALVGLVVMAFSFAIVSFVVGSL